MTVPVAQSVNGLCIARFKLWVTGVLLLNAHHRVARLAWVREHRDWSVEDWKQISPDLNHIKHLRDVLEQAVKDHHKAPTSLTELWIALANIWLVIPVERFQELVESMHCLVAVII
ncbi:DDE_3 domain-containing protein [Trichonephila clavipes]|nr:DDE_3 domain-containing protein [Trichonephila clavipes]